MRKIMAIAEVFDNASATRDELMRIPNDRLKEPEVFIASRIKGVSVVTPTVLKELINMALKIVNKEMSTVLEYWDAKSIEIPLMEGESIDDCLSREEILIVLRGFGHDPTPENITDVEWEFELD